MVEPGLDLRGGDSDGCYDCCRGCVPGIMQLVGQLFGDIIHVSEIISTAAFLSDHSSTHVAGVSARMAVSAAAAVNGGWYHVREL